MNKLYFDILTYLRSEKWTSGFEIIHEIIHTFQNFISIIVIKFEKNMQPVWLPYSTLYIALIFSYSTLSLSVWILYVPPHNKTPYKRWKQASEK